MKRAHKDECCTQWLENTKAKSNPAVAASSIWPLKVNYFQINNGLALFAALFLVVSSAVCQVTAYPNPATGMLTLSGLEAGYTINVYDTTGKPCASGPVKEQSQDIYLYSLKTGTYILEIMDTNGTTIKRLKVEKR